jgi:hypothetical protein
MPNQMWKDKAFTDRCFGEDMYNLVFPEMINLANNGEARL